MNGFSCSYNGASKCTTLVIIKLQPELWDPVGVRHILSVFNTVRDNFNGYVSRRRLVGQHRNRRLALSGSRTHLTHWTNIIGRGGLRVLYLHKLMGFASETLFTSCHLGLWEMIWLQPRAQPQATHFQHQNASLRRQQPSCFTLHGCLMSLWSAENVEFCESMTYRTSSLSLQVITISSTFAVSGFSLSSIKSLSRSILWISTSTLSPNLPPISSRVSPAVCSMLTNILR
jgi:hypothetical protein